MSVIYNNYSTQNIYDGMQFWLSEGKYTAKELGYDEYNAKKQTFLENNRNNIFNIKNVNGAELPLNDISNYYTGKFTGSALSNISETIGAWEKLSRISNRISGNGTVYGWDLETFGDITTANGIAKGAGVTEYGLSRTIYENGMITGVTNYSILAKLDQPQVDYINDIISKYKASGDWNSLDDIERVTLDRISMYRNAVFKDATVDYAGVQTFRTVTNINTAMGRNIKAVEDGLTNIMNNGNDPAKIIPYFKKVLLQGTNDNTVLGGANTSGFDVKILKGLGFSDDEVNSVYLNTTDMTMAQRVIATSENITTAELNNRVKNAKMKNHTKDSNTVGAMMESLGYTENQYHVAGPDAEYTVKGLTTQDYYNGKSFTQNVIDAHAKGIQQSKDLQNGIVLLKTGYLDKNAMDQVRTGDEVTQSYSISGAYWIFDQEKSGMTKFTPEGELATQDVFIASFKSAVEGEEVEFSKMFKDKDAFDSWLTYNGIIIDKNDVAKGNIDTQSRYHSLDFGRREYDRFFEISSPARAGENAINGYSSLDAYLNAWNDIKAYLIENEINPETADLFDSEMFNKIVPILEENGIKNNYKKRAFVGMHRRLRDESDVLTHIRDFAYSKTENNLERTKIVHDMYEAFTNEMSKNISGTDYNNNTYLLTDVFSIDLLGSDGKYHTLSSNNSGVLASNIRRLYENSETKSVAASLDDIRRGVDDLYSRGVIDKRARTNLINELSNDPSLFNATNSVANALSGIFEPFENRSAISVYKQIMTKAEDDLTTAELSIRYKNVGGLPPSTGLKRMMTGGKITSSSEFISSNSYFNSSANEHVKEVLNIAGENATGRINFVTNLNMNNNADFFTDLGAKLGYSNEQLGMVSRMFNAKKRDKSGVLDYASYAIDKYKNDGLVSAIVSPNEAGNSGYVVLTNTTHANKTYELLSGVANKDLTYDEMKTLLDGNAGIFELKAIHKTPVGEIPEALREIYGTSQANSTFVNQGANTTRYLHPSLNLYVADGVLHGGLAEAGSDIIKSFTLGGGHAIEAILANDFNEGTRIFKKYMDAAITGQSGSASYQGMLDSAGERFRGTNFNESDLIHGFFFEYKKGLETIQDHILTNGGFNNDFTNLLWAFNEGMPEKIVSRDTFDYDPDTAYKKIMQSSSWKEFWTRHLNEPLSNNDVIKNAMSTNDVIKKLNSEGVFDKTLIELLIDTSLTLNTNDNTAKFLNQFKAAAKHFSQNLGETYVNSGYFSAIDPGSLFAYAPGSGINRPVAYQRLHVRNMLPESLPLDYLNKTGSVIGSLTITPNSKMWKELDNLTLPDGAPHSSQVSSIMTGFKELSDHELQANYKYVKENLEALAGNDYDLELLKEAYDAQVKAAPTIYGDNIILSSTMATTFNKLGLDTKKLTFDRISRIEDESDLRFTTKKLYSLEGKVVRKGDVIGRDSRGLIYWEGLETKLTKNNIDDILNSGKAAITPLNSIESRKIFIGGAEKAIANGVIVNEEFLKNHHFMNAEEAHKYLDFIFEKVLMPHSGTIGYIPSAGGNMSVAKHLSGTHLQSSLNLIFNEYRKAGKLDFLAQEMYNNGYNHWFTSDSLNDAGELENVFYNSKLLIDTENTNFSSDVIKLLKDIKSNNFGDRNINQAITDIFSVFTKEKLGLLDIQNNVQNQIMGTRLEMNPRLDASIRRRNEAEFYLSSEDGVNGVLDGVNGLSGKRYEEIMLDEMRKTTTSGADDYIRASDLGNASSLFNQEIERISKRKNSSIIRERAKMKEQEKVLAGIKEASDFFMDPSLLEKRTNILTISMDELTKQIPTPSKENLANSIFKPNGKFSNNFIDLMNANNIDSNTNVLTVALDLGQEFTIKNGNDSVTLSKILVPLYNVYDDFENAATKEDDTFFVRSMGDFMNFFSVYKENIHKIDDKSINKIANALVRYRNALAGELATDDKTSLAFKLGGKFPLPNSTFLLGQDEIAPVTEAMLQEDMLNITSKINNLQQRIRNGDGTANELLSELSDAFNQRKEMLEKIGKDIDSTGKIELYGNKLIGFEGYTESTKGGFLNVNAVNRNTFEQRLDFDIGLFGKSLFEDIKTGSNSHYMSIGTRTFSINSDNIKEIEMQVVENLKNNLGENFEYTGFLATDLENTMTTIRDANKELLNSKSGRANYDILMEEATKAINNAFDFIGEKYLKEIGITARLAARFPAFGVGIGPANLILDDNVGDSQLRVLGPGFSKTMNLDHDGDILGIAIHNAANAMRRSGKNAAEIAATLKVIERNALDDYRILKEMIIGGEAFATDNVSDIYFNEAAVFKTYRPKAYEKAYNAFLKSTGIDKSQYADDAIDFIAAYSPQMRKAIDAYNSANGNFLKSAEATIAALKAKTTKENIGLISNASFSLHDAVSVAFSKTNNEAKKKRLATLHSYMDYVNVDSSKGSLGMNGLMTIAEQKGIDVKHILSATKINQTDKFTSGMRSLMNTNQMARQNNVQNGLVDIMSSLNHTLFNGAETNEIAEIANQILNTTIEDYTKLIREANDKDVVKDLIVRTQLRALYELSEEDSVRMAYNNPARRFRTSYSKFMEGILNLESYASNSNVASKSLEIYGTVSDAKLELQENLIYLSGGDINRPNKMYMIQPYNSNTGEILRQDKNKRLFLELTEVDPSDINYKGSIKQFSGKSVNEIMGKVNKFLSKDDNGFISIEARTLTEGTNTLALSKFNISKQDARAINILNNLFTDTSYNNINKYFEKGGNRYFRDSKKHIPNFIQSIMQDVGYTNMYLIDSLVESVDEDDLSQLYGLREFIATKNSKISNMSFNELIRSVNANIINNPHKYANSTEFLSYSDIVKNKLKSLVGENNYLNYLEKYNSISSNFDTETFNKSVDFLRKNIYNVTEEEKALLQGIEDLKGFKELGIADIDNALEVLPNSIEQHIKKINAAHVNNVHLVESKIYNLFDSKNSINNFFGWNKAIQNGSVSRFTEVGFGEFIGFRFDQLSQADIDKIFKFAKENEVYYTNNDNEFVAHAYQRTINLLEAWTKENPAMSKTNAINYKISQKTLETLEELTSLKSLGNRSKIMLETAEEIASENTNKKTLRGIVNDISTEKIKDFFSNNKKAIGIATASLAAIGVANNLLHNQKNKSPLTPSRISGAGNSPSYNSPAENHTPIAPLSKRATIYHDKGSGFNFKVSASTRNHIDAQNNAKLIGMSGGGNPSVYTQSDTSGITDNWLANKFAELV